MARVTVEDCLEREDNRFALVVLAAQRTRALMKGAGALVAFEEQGRGHGASRNRRRQGPLRPPDERGRSGVHRGDEQPRVRLSRRDRPSPGNERSASGAPPARRDRELEAGSLAHYEDPAYYTATYANRIEDVAYYVGLAPAIGRARARVRRRQRAHRAPHRAPRDRRRGRRSLGADAGRPAGSPCCGGRRGTQTRSRGPGRHAPRPSAAGAFRSSSHVQHGPAPLHARGRRTLSRPRARAPGAARPVRPRPRRCRRSAISARPAGRPYNAPRFRHPTAGAVVPQPRVLRLRSLAASALRVDGVRARRATRAARG